MWCLAVCKLSSCCLLPAAKAPKRRHRAGSSELQPPCSLQPHKLTKLRVHCSPSAIAIRCGFVRASACLALQAQLLRSSSSRPSSAQATNAVRRAALGGGQMRVPGRSDQASALMAWLWV